LIAAAHEAKRAVRAVPGPSAVVAALSVSGLPATPFRFAGYPPRTAGQLRAFVERCVAAGETTVLFEAPGRVGQTVNAIAAAESDAAVVICRELTKLYEQVARGTAAEIARMLADESIPAKGEFVIVVRGTGATGEFDVDRLLVNRLRAGDGPSQAARAIAAESGRSKSELYRRALAIKASGQVD
jgi:16S rRNA (cytidine1402-2'-O)-methyltransferase